MKRLLIASALALVTAGCATEAVQRDLPPQFQGHGQLAFYKKLQVRTSASDASGFQFSRVGEDRSSPDRGRVSSDSSESNGTVAVGTDTADSDTPTPETLAAADQSGNSTQPSPQSPSVEGVDAVPSPGEEPTAPGAGNEEQPTEPVDEGESSQPPAQETPPTAPGGASGKPKKDNPSCANSGGNAATCG